MNQDEQEKLWRDENNWSGGKVCGLYFCKSDPRLVVPKRKKWMGWTINFGHRLACLVLTLILLVPILVIARVILFRCRV